MSLTVRMTDMPLLEIDAHRLRQLVKLLVENAVKFTTEGRIGVQATFFAGKLKLVVEDTGCGIGEEDMERVPMVGHTFIRVLRRIGVFKTPAENES